MLLIWRLFLLGTAAVLLWLVATDGMVRYHQDRAKAGDDDAIDRVLALRPQDPYALRERARATLPDDPDAAMALFAESYRRDPTNPDPLLVWAGLLLARGDTEKADALADLAHRLRPADVNVQRQLAIYWDQRGEPEAALAHQAAAMTSAPGAQLRSYYFPPLLKIAEDPGLRRYLEPLAEGHPNWWDGFFNVAARQAESVDTVRWLFALSRRNGDPSLLAPNRRAFVDRLIRDGRFSEAYLVWLNGLDDRARRHLAPLFDGGFELPLSGEGFGWQTRDIRQRRADLLYTLGITGQQAVRIRFSAFEGPGVHLSQRLLLQPGRFRLTGQVRLDDLESKGGVRWQLLCPDRRPALLAATEPFMGSADWTAFAVELEVPADCESQILRLVTAGEYDFERKLHGVIWFDDMRIARVDEGADTAGAEPDTRGSDR